MAQPTGNKYIAILFENIICPPSKKVDILFLVWILSRLHQQWRSRKAEKAKHIKESLLYQAMH